MTESLATRGLDLRPCHHADMPKSVEPRRQPAADVRRLAWVAEQLGIGVSTAYRLAEAGQIPGAFRVGRQWRVSTVAFARAVHGERAEERAERAERTR